MSEGQPQDKWKIEVNDRYQKVIGTVMSLATGSLLLPMLFLREFLAVPKEKAVLAYLNWRVYTSWAFLVWSILLGTFYYYLSGKWVKLAWRQAVSISAARLERFLDWSFWLAIATFLLGLIFVLWFMVAAHTTS